MAITNCPMIQTPEPKNFKLVERSLDPSWPTKSPPAEDCLLSCSPIAPRITHEIDHSSKLMHKVSFESLKGVADPTRPLIKVTKDSSGKDHQGQVHSLTNSFID